MPGQKFGPAWFPGLIAIGLAICGAPLVRAGLRERAPLFAMPQWMQRSRPRRAVAAILAGLIVAILSSECLGLCIKRGLVRMVLVQLFSPMVRLDPRFTRCFA